MNLSDTEGGDEWALTVQLGDAQGRKVTTETLRFRDVGHAEAALAPLSGGAMMHPKQIYTVRNEAGESISFVGERYISHSLLRIEPTEFDFEV